MSTPSAAPSSPRAWSGARNGYSLTADYAFGHDLRAAAQKFIGTNGGSFIGDELVPTDASDFSAFLLKIRNGNPDIVVSNLAGNQITNFLKQYSEFGLKATVAGFTLDTALAWAAGAENFAGTWPLIWHHCSTRPARRSSSPTSRRSTASRRRTRPGATMSR